VNLAAGAMQKNQNGADIPDKPLFVKTLGIVDAYPAGCPIPYPGRTAPDGYLLMDGRAFSKTLYPQLAKLYQNGVSPDLRGMHIRGWDNGRGFDVPGGKVSDLAAGTIPPNEFKYGVAPDGYGYFAIAGTRLVESGPRNLLSTQYFEKLMPAYGDRLAYDNYVSSYRSRLYLSISPGQLIPNVKGAPDFKSSSSELPISTYIDRGMIPLGAPNIVFNYITKAA
ncbi:tail fiber protein, partial [Salmonella enterica]|nr:tail fiber protein [Salmonella enterica]